MRSTCWSSSKGYDEELSRLCCQIKIEDVDAEELVLVVPKHAHNLFDFIPFDDTFSR